MDWTDSIKNRLVSFLGHILISILLHSCRLRIHGELPAIKGSRIFIFWHRHLLYLMFHFRHQNARPLISLSSDGEIISTISKKFGMKPIRGSSSRGGARALLELIGLAKTSDNDILITADGPKGPLRTVKPGLVKLAVKSGAPLIPACWKASRSWVLTRSWDQFIIPKPFSKIDFFFGKAIDLRGIDEEKVAEIMKTLEKTHNCV